ncbi:hypothetical protein JWG45_00940 [Leptospira sp. 201903070]|uniref:PilZ domain-containing protein n=1 Tax=Leptospira ainlahdjerensis TaxID=2810033 RepID=A0ABS2U5Q9_9LEPT|nr:hypothetical protein [Leptospira ainlahdjerensis]MBM9575707.1 hypothetical protein [Leptospira ainlahdjerensis]
MGYYSQNMITNFEEVSDKDLIVEMDNFFQIANVKEFHSDFHGIVAQVDRSRVVRECASDRMDEIEELMVTLDERTVEFSRLFPEKNFVYITVNCFGGQCSYEGFCVKNGEIIFTQPSKEDGHIELLKRLNSKFESFYFDPFSRDFFVRKGRIEGVIQDLSLGALFIGLNSEYTDKTLYRIDGSSELFCFERREEYYFVFESKNGSEDIEVSGVVYNDDPQMLQEMEDLILDFFSIRSYSVSIFLEGISEERKYEHRVESSTK